MKVYIQQRRSIEVEVQDDIDWSKFGFKALKFEPSADFIVYDETAEDELFDIWVK